MNINISRKGEGTLNGIMMGLIIVVLILMFVIPFTTDIFGKTKDNVEVFYGCGTLGIGKGVCKDSCSSDEFELKNIGCPPKNQKSKIYCCINPDDKDNFLPSPYGGSSDYSAQVRYVGLDKNPPDGCQSVKADTEITCSREKDITLKVKVGYTSIGSVKDAKFYAAPVLVTNDNNDKMVTSYGSKDSKRTSSIEGVDEVLSDVTIKQDDIKKGDYVKIYAYIKCDAADCNAAANPKGILKTNEQFITVKFP